MTIFLIVNLLVAVVMIYVLITANDLEERLGAIVVILLCILSSAIMLA